MDRREALKKLGAGTAIAAAGPVLLPSFNVAHAASGGIGETGLLGVPIAGAPVPYFHVQGSGSSRRRQVGITIDNGGVSCANGSTPEFSVQWRVVGVLFDSRGPKPVRLVVNGGGTELASSPLRETGFWGGSYGSVSSTESVVMQKLRSNGRADLLRSGDLWSIEARCRWHCPGSSVDVVAEYFFGGSGYGGPIVYNTAWNDAASA